MPIKGVNKLRRTLNRIDPELTKQIKQDMEDGAEAIRLDAIARVPVRTGDLAHSIEAIHGRDGLTYVIGPAARAASIVGARSSASSPFALNSRKRVKLSLKNKQRLMQFFKGYWVEFGTKGNSRLNIPPQPARPFMGPAFDVNKEWIKDNIKTSMKDVLDRASRL